MALERYRQKRDFKITPEPAGKVGKRRTQGLTFIIQKHAATRLHYDFRLELNGVLLSWAVPKGPSLDPNDKRLAVHTEDHPMEYGQFEGVIPAKQYGAGTVMLWDRGTWVPKGDPDEGYKKGHLKFELDGEKLKGGWNLIRSRSSNYGGDKSWLLIKEADDYARLGPEGRIVDDHPDSVVSGRSLDQIASAGDRVWHSNKSVDANVKGGAIRKRARKTSAKLEKIDGAHKRAMPDVIDAQLATLVKSPPDGANWVHEIKYDGYRMLCRLESGEVRLISRNRKDWTDHFPTVAQALTRLNAQTAWLDGEVVVLDDKGRSRFQSLQNALAGDAPAPLHYFAIDVLYLDGVDLRGVALIERKQLLESLLEGAPATVRYSQHFDVPGEAFKANVCKLGLEGMVSKRADLPYQAGRGSAWQKTKCEREQEMVIGGFTDPEGSRHAFGALLLGVYDREGRLTYSGKVGTGFNTKTLEDLHRKLLPLEQKTPAFHNPPRGAEARRAHWVKPRLVAVVKFTEWTADGTLRHPSYVQLREDKPAKDVVREIEAEPSSGDDPPSAPPVRAKRAAKGHGARDRDAIDGVALTNPDKVLYPEAGLTKRDLASYYAEIGKWMVPHLRERPLTLVRCPNGWDKKCFYQKNADDSLHESISRVRVDIGDGGAFYSMANSVSAIVALLQMGVLEIHPWGSREGKLGEPDRIIFDLDPDEGLGWDEVKQAVLVVKTLIENIGLVPFVKTTGGKGLHVVVPIAPTVDWDTVKGFTKAVSELLENTFPDRFTAKLLKASRKERIFIDYLRNAEGATAVAAYSLRAKANAPVATPVAWDELTRDLRFAHFNTRNVPQRLAKLKHDPWEKMASSEKKLTAAIMARVGYKPGAER